MDPELNWRSIKFTGKDVGEVIKAAAERVEDPRSAHSLLAVAFELSLLLLRPDGGSDIGSERLRDQSLKHARETARRIFGDSKRGAG